MKFPASFFTVISAHINFFGEDVTYFPFAGGSFTIKASVQAPAEEPLIGDGEQEGFFVFVPREAISAPEKFDRLLIRGRERTVEDVSETKVINETVCWILRVVG
jgi:hypothetical protein